MKLHVQMLFVLLACNKMCLSVLIVMLIGFDMKKSHNYPTMRSISKKNLKLDERYLPWNMIVILRGMRSIVS